MRTYNMKRKICNACIFLSIPYTVFIPVSVLLASSYAQGYGIAILQKIAELLLEAGKTDGFAGTVIQMANSDFLCTAVDVLYIALVAAGPLALIVSTVLSGTMGRVFKKAFRSAYKVWYFCPPVVTVLFFLIFLAISIYIFNAIIMFMLAVPSVSIARSFRERFPKNKRHARVCGPDYEVRAA